MVELLDFLGERHPECVLERRRDLGEATVVIRRQGMVGFFQALKETEWLDFNFLMDITALDFPMRPERFEVVYHLYSLSKNHRLRVKIRVHESNPEVDSLTHLWKSANWLEREVWDMYGIRFKEHPDLRRILLYEEFEGHPLRKDYPANRRQPLVEHREVDGTFCDETYRK